MKLSEVFLGILLLLVLMIFVVIFVVLSPFLLLLWLFWRLFCLLHVRVCVERPIFSVKPLHRAFLCNDFSGVKLLVERGVDLRMGRPTSYDFVALLFNQKPATDEDRFAYVRTEKDCIRFLQSVGVEKLHLVELLEPVLSFSIANRKTEVRNWLLSGMSPVLLDEKAAQKLVSDMLSHDVKKADELLTRGFPLPKELPYLYGLPKAIALSIVEKHRLLRRAGIPANTRRSRSGI